MHGLPSEELPRDRLHMDWQLRLYNAPAPAIHLCKKAAHNLAWKFCRYGLSVYWIFLWNNLIIY